MSRNHSEFLWVFLTSMYFYKGFVGLFVLISVFLSHLLDNTFPWMNPNISNYSLSLLLRTIKYSSQLIQLQAYDFHVILPLNMCGDLHPDMWGFFPILHGCLLAGSHSKLWECSPLGHFKPFSLSQIFFHSQHVLLLPKLPKKIMIEGYELLHCCSSPASSFSFIADSEKALPFFLYRAYLLPTLLIPSQLQYFFLSYIINLSWLTAFSHASYVPVLQGW